MRKALAIAAVSALLLALVFSQAFAVTVIKGSIKVAPTSGCAATPGCFAWYAAGCPANLALKDGVDFSAADVSAAAGKLATFSSTGIPFNFGGDFAYVAFLKTTPAPCQFMTGGKQFAVGVSVPLTVPAGAKWMTVTGTLVTGSNLTWSLTF